MHVFRPALASACLFFLTLGTHADTTSTVIPAGNSAALGSTATPAPETPEARLLHNALTPETRSKLQTAVNSAGQ